MTALKTCFVRAIWYNALPVTLPASKLAANFKLTANFASTNINNLKINRLQTMRLAPIVAAVLFFFSGCSADDKDDVSATIEVRGTVTSDIGQLLAGVLVKSAQDSTFTDDKGKYSLRSYPRGSIEYSKLGYVTYIEPVEEQKTIDVTLKRILDGSATRFEEKLVPLHCGDDTAAVAQVIEIMDFGQGTGTMTWTKNKVWLLKNSVFVNEGQTLTIEPGTIVKGASGSPDSTGALVVAKGGSLIAEGTPEMPILFTAEQDSIVRDTNGVVCNQGGLSSGEKGLWRGIILLGKATLADGQPRKAGGFPDFETRAGFGGNDDRHQAAKLRHVAIRHAGKQAAGLTLAGIGTGTVLEHIEVSASGHAGYRFVGGAVSTKHLAALHNNGDAFVAESGWHGLNQFWFAVGNGGAALAGKSSPDSSGQWLPGPVIANATFIGQGGPSMAAVQTQDSSTFLNCVFVKYAFIVAAMPDPDTVAEVEKHQDRLPFFFHNIFHLSAVNDGVPPNGEAADAPPATGSYPPDGLNGNRYVHPGLNVRFVPMEGSPAAMGGPNPSGAFFENAPFRGCFGPGKTPWIMDND